MRLQGKIALLTGAAAAIKGELMGFGGAAAHLFVREGAKVVAADFSGSEKDTAAEVGHGVLPVHCDVTSEADVEALMQAAIS